MKFYKVRFEVNTPEVSGYAELEVAALDEEQAVSKGIRLAREAFVPVDYTTKRTVTEVLPC